MNNQVNKPILPLPTKKGRGNIPRNVGIKAAIEFIKKYNDKIEEAYIAGSLIRGHRLTKDVDVIAVTNKKISVAPPINLFTCTKATLETHFLYLAPGMAVVSIRARASSKGYRLNRYGLYNKRNNLVSRSVAEICNLISIDIPIPVRHLLNGFGQLTNAGIVKNLQFEECVMDYCFDEECIEV